MDPNQVQQPIVSQEPIVATVVSTPKPPEPSGKKGFDPKQVLDKLRSRFADLKIPKKIIFAAGGLLVLLVVLSIVMKIVGSTRGTVSPSGSQTPAPSDAPIVETPSQYADDPDVAEIKSKMDELDRQLDEAEFRDDTLRVPTLDWDVKFDE